MLRVALRRHNAYVHAGREAVQDSHAQLLCAPPWPTSAGVTLQPTAGDGALAMAGPAAPQEPQPPWWLAPLSEDPPDLSIFDGDWGERPEGDRPLLPDGTRAGPYWDSLDTRLRKVRAPDERLWVAAGALALDDEATGAYSSFNDSGVEAALRLGAHINAPCPVDRDMTALHYAARNGTRAFVERLLDQGANISATTGE